MAYKLNLIKDQLFLPPAPTPTPLLPFGSVQPPHYFYSTNIFKNRLSAYLPFIKESSSLPNFTLKNPSIKNIPKAYDSKILNQRW